jgi:ribosomal protein S18 acetylase RimI-like enzyme
LFIFNGVQEMLRSFGFSISDFSQLFVFNGVQETPNCRKMLWSKARVLNFTEKLSIKDTRPIGLYSLFEQLIFGTIMTGDAQINISVFSADDITTCIHELGGLLYACVHAGASIGFVLPYTQADGEAYWTNKVLPAVSNGKLIMLAVRKNGRIAGSVQLDYDTMPNQPHRAEVRKLLVHPDFRRQGIAKGLMAELELLASQLGRSLLTLDTRTGDTAEPLYTSLGYQTVGVIPGYCLDPFDGSIDSTTIMYKNLQQ